MPGLSIAARRAHLDALERRALDRPRLGDGSRRLAITPCDAAVYGALAFDFHNGASGRCDPGYRAIAAKAGVSLGIVGPSTRRLAADGWLKRRRFLRYAHGSMRFCYDYVLFSERQPRRSEFIAKPLREFRKAVDNPKIQSPVRSVKEQLAYLAQGPWRSCRAEPGTPTG
jgi:hypothetical protein